MQNFKTMKTLFSSSALLAIALIGFTSCSQESGNKKIVADGADASVQTAPQLERTNDMDLNRDQKESQRPKGPLTTISFDKVEHDFGNIKEGDVVEHVFKFTNTGKEPLIIESAKGSCGCTVPEYPKEPLAPGKTGEMKVKFNSQAKVNKQRKTVTVIANTAPENTTLTIVADVEPMPRPEGGETIRK